MPIYNVRPFSDIGVIGSPTKTGGTGTYASCVNDSSDSSWVQLTGTSCAYVASMPWPLSLASNEYITKYRMVVRYDTGNGTTDFYVYVPGGDADYYIDNLSVSGLQTRYGAWKTVDPGTGGELNANSFPQLTMWDRGLGTTKPRITEAWIEVVTNYSGVPVGTGPNATLTDNSQPTFTWSYSDGESEAQVKFRVKIFADYQIAVSGFDPNDYTPLIDSGEVVSGSYSWKPPVPLDNGTYRAYISVMDSGSGHWSPCTISGPYAYVILNVTQPAAPTITSFSAPNTTFLNENMTLQGRDNWLSEEDASFEGGTTGNWIFGGNVTVTNKATGGKHGSRCLKILSNAAGNMVSSMAKNAYGGTYGSATLQTQILYGEVAIKAISSARLVRLDILYYDASLNLVGTAMGATFQEIVGKWVKISVTGSGPSTALYAALNINVFNAGAANEEHDVDCTTLRPWTPINLLEDPSFQGVDSDADGLSDVDTGVTGAWAKYAFGGTDTSYCTLVYPDTQPLNVYAGKQTQSFYTGAAVGGGNWRGISQAINVPLNAFISAQVWIKTDVAGAVIGMYNTCGSGSDNQQTWTLAANTWTAISLQTWCDLSYNGTLYIRSSTAGATFYVGCVNLSSQAASPDAVISAWTRGGLATPSRFEVQRSTDGINWAKVKRISYGSNLIDDLSTFNFADFTLAAQVTDYELPPSSPTYYRIRTFAVGGSGFTIYSPWSPAFKLTYTYTPNNKWLIKAPYKPLLETQFDMKGDGNNGLVRESTEISAFFNPISRSRSVKVSDVIQGDIMELTVVCLTQAQIDAFEALRATQTTLLIVSPDGKYWYAAMQNKVKKMDLLTAGQVYAERTVTFEEQDAPA